MTSRDRARRLGRVLAWSEGKPLPVRVVLMWWMLREKKRTIRDARREVIEGRERLRKVLGT